MRNHHEKTKDMAESVLPSTARRRARTERRRIHRAQRARERVALARCDLGGADDFDPDFGEGRRLSAIEWMVWDRRAADKIGSLSRWAIAVVRADPNLRDADVDVQVEYFARLFPDNLIGRHAVQHIEWALSAEIRRSDWQDRCLAVARQREEHRSDVARQAVLVMESGHHGGLNAALRDHYGDATPDDAVAELPHVRYVLGAHDIEAFTDDIAADSGVCRVIADLAAEIASTSRS